MIKGKRYRINESLAQIVNTKNRMRAGSKRSDECRPTRISVLFSCSIEQAHNPYIIMLRDSLTSTGRVTPIGFSWRQAFGSGYDIFHIQWPENLVRGRTGMQARRNQILASALLILLKSRRIPIVSTLHNQSPHEAGSRVENVILKMYAKATAHRIYLDYVPEGIDMAVSSIIPHGHYRTIYPGWDDASLVSRREPIFLCFGHIREYKQVPTLVEKFLTIPQQDVQLIIAGKCDNPQLIRRIDSVAQSDPRVKCIFEYVNDRDLIRQIQLARIVVLPYSNMENSGAALLALSLGTPVLGPDSQTLIRLRSEAGAAWVSTYSDPTITAKALLASLSSTATLDSHFPVLPRREWTATAQSHISVYECVTP